MVRFCCLLLLISSTSLFASVWQGDFSKKTHFSVCFTPGGHCTDVIVDVINHAGTSIDVQAYSFTSRPIIEALLAAAKRGVFIDVLLDKSNVHQTYSAMQVLEINHIPFLIDSKPSIAHNKVMVIDHNTVITGSFNFTKNAQARNAENALIITSSKLAQYYEVNFNQRKKVSLSLLQYKMKRTLKHLK